MCSFRQDLYLNMKKNFWGQSEAFRTIDLSLVNDSGVGSIKVIFIVYLSNSKSNLSFD